MEYARAGIPRQLTMRIKIIAAGRLKPDSPLVDLIHEYTKQMKWMVTVVEYVVQASEKDIAKLLSIHAPKGSYLIALDEKGQNLTSQQFSQLLDRVRTDHTMDICFLIGGADGIPQAIKNQADYLLSFGSCTWPHMMMRLLLTEQLYRAQQILLGHPYHR